MLLATGAIINEIIKDKKYAKFYQQMSIEDATKMRDELINTLVVFDKMCRKYKLRYMLTAGALIGAVRDKEALIWDDDIDLVMPRPDYDKLREVYEKSEYKKEYVLKYPQDNKVITMGMHFYRRNARLTDIIDNSIGESDIYEPYAYMDILPLESVPNSQVKRKLVGNLVNALQMGFISRRCFKKHDPFLNFLAKDSKKLALNLKIREAFSLPFMLVKKKTMFSQLDHILKYDSHTKMVTVPYGALRYFGEMVPRKVYLPVSEIELNGHMVMAPHDPAAYLANRYGDYMTPPTEAEKKERLIRLRGDWQNLVNS